MDQTTGQSNILALEKALKLQTQAMAKGTPIAPPPPTHINRNVLLLSGVLLLGTALACRRFTILSNPWALPATALEESISQIRSEEEAFAKFMKTAKISPAILAADLPLEEAPPKNELLEKFFAQAPAILAELHNTLPKITGAAEVVSQQGALAELDSQVRTLKDAANLPELLPVFQLTSAVEGLIKQLTTKASNITPSALRTVAGGVYFLKELCVRGLRPDILTNPPLRLLAVDDDLISRKVVVFSLKKAFNQPDLAENGEAALALVNKHSYDAVFLDVQMPGMDGYEVCQRIHQTELNRNTPVVFVTCVSDFEGRAQSARSGGNDLIAKPFLTFEITVKAMTLVLQGRLRQRVQPVPQPTAVIAAAAKPVIPAETVLSDVVKDEQDISQALGGQAASDLSPGAASSNPLPAPTPPGEQAGGELISAFLTRAAAELGGLRNQVKAVFQKTDENAWPEMQQKLFSKLCAMTPPADSAPGHPALRMSFALQGLLKKLIEQPKNRTHSTKRTVATALDLLHELCVARVKADLAANPPVRILAVDDEPIARRAITGALQMAFDKPDSVDSGEAALAAATERAYDVIFMDVQMPGMDGFTACLRIHETVPNHTTPVVFVTGQSDFKARSQADISGGTDFLVKPFLTAEITLKALTLIFRNRLRGRLPAAEPAQKSPSPAVPDLSGKPGGDSEALAEQQPATVPPSEASRLAPPPAEPSAHDDSSAGLPTLSADTPTAVGHSAHISANLVTLQTMLQAIAQSGAADEPSDQLMDFYLLLHSLTVNIGLTGLEKPAELSAAVEKLIQKLQDSPGSRTPSAMHTISTALDLLADLCGGKLSQAPDSELPIRILVLDADVTSRRQVVAALQTVFDKPASEEEVAAALALTREKAFDVIFMALQLPGVDGFAVGAKIHEVPANARTPLVFLASENDYEVYADSIRSEGLEIIAKPVLPAEISVKALTLARRRRRAGALEDSPDAVAGLAVPA